MRYINSLASVKIKQSPCKAQARGWSWSSGVEGLPCMHTALGLVPRSPKKSRFPSLLSPDPCPYQVPNCTDVIYASNKPTTGNLETFFPPWSRPCVVQLNVQFKLVLVISVLKTARHPPSNPWIRKPFLEQLLEVLRLQTIKP